MKKLVFTVGILFLAVVLMGEDNSDIKQKIIQSSISSYRGSCPCPYNIDRAGRRCGRRSAYSRPGGYSPICYESDVTTQMVENYKQAHPARNLITGKVVKVSDGDTLTVLNSQNKQIKVRLYGIDAPEKSQDFGTVAKDYLAGLVAGQTITVTVIDIDQYGRNVGRIKVGNKEVSEEMLVSGLAWFYTTYCSIPECTQWKSLETQAKTAKIGLWANPTAQEPWLWRQEHR